MWQEIKKYFEEFKILKLVPKDFWILNLVVNFFEMLAYFAFITLLSLYLTNNLGFDDTTTGDIMGYFTLSITVIIFFAGPIIDTIGIKKALIISMAILIPFRFFMGATDYIERHVVKAEMDEEAMIAQIQEKGYWQKAFTTKPDKFIAAQADIVLSSPEASKKGYTFKKLKDDSQTLRAETLSMIAASEAIKEKWEPIIRSRVGEKIKGLKGNSNGDEEGSARRAELAEESLTGDWAKLLSEGSKDTQTYKELVTDMVAEHEALAAKYFFHFDKLQGEDRISAAVETIIAFPDLRSQFGINSLLRILVLISLGFIAIGEALMVPAIYVAVRRYTNPKTSGAGFNFQYLSMNVGAVLSFVLMDAVRAWFGNEVGTSVFFIMAGFFAIICTVGAMLMRYAMEVKEDGEVVLYESEAAIKGGEKKENPVGIIIDVVKEKAFWRFMLFIFLLIGVKLVFTHQFMVMPKYYMRVLGPDAPIGILNTINPIIIVIGLILFIPIIARYSVFRLIVVGTFVSAISVFILVLPGKFFTIIGWSIERGYFAIILAQVIVFAFGEIIWSPRLSEYTVTIAPKGREGTYMSLAALPMFIAKPLNGIISGRLLEAFCPEDVMNDIVTGVRSWYNGPEMMWLIFALISISSPILVLLLRNVIRGKEEDSASPEGEVAKESAG